MVLRLTCLLLGTLISFPSFTQSLEDLENEVLSGKPSSSQTSSTPLIEEDLDSSQIKSSSRSNNDEDLFFKEEAKSKEVDESVYKDIDEMLTGPKSIPLKHIFVVKHQYVFKKVVTRLFPSL
ncbi:MAG: hypothetical protein R3A80_08470 [Bdellovibrionota bacterium]